MHNEAHMKQKKTVVSATLTIEAAAKELGISRHTAYQCAKEGQIPTIKMGRRLLVPRVRLEALLRGEAQKARA